MTAQVQIANGAMMSVSGLSPAGQTSSHGTINVVSDGNDKVGGTLEMSGSTISGLVNSNDQVSEMGSGGAVRAKMSVSGFRIPLSAQIRPLAKRPVILEQMEAQSLLKIRLMVFRHPKLSGRHLSAMMSLNVSTGMNGAVGQRSRQVV